MIIDGSNMAQAPAEARPADVLLLDVLRLMMLLIGRVPGNILCMATAFTICSSTIVDGANFSVVVVALSSHGSKPRPQQKGDELVLRPRYMVPVNLKF